MKHIITIIFLSLPVFAMGYDKADTALWNVSITPQNLFNNCIRFDLERRLSSNNWIGMAQQIYVGPIIETDDSIYGARSTVLRYNTPHKNDAISGAGWVLEDKIFFHPQYRGYSDFFFTFGASFSLLNIAYQDNAWVQYQQNGSIYYSYLIKNANMKIDRNSFFIAFGISTARTSSFHLDMTIGGGIQGTNTTYSGLPSGYRNYNRSILDFQHEGVYPLITYQLGLLF